MGGDRSTDGGKKLLSKMVRFVTNPTTQWSELDHLDDADTEGATTSQSRLKGLIARKKRNDAVRGRELGLLRKLLRRTGSQDAADTDGAPVAQTEKYIRPPAAPDAETERARTLQKIDELDAQLKGGGPLAAARGQRAGSAPEVVTKAPPADHGAIPSLRPSRSVGMQLGPEIEEVAIHFANGNFADAESSLLRQIAADGAHHDDEQVWLMLFDLYRATGQSNKFNDLGVDFADCFERSSPQWLLKLDGDDVATMLDRPESVPDKADWRVPPLLDESALAQLQMLFTADKTRFSVDWRGLDIVDPAALSALQDVLQRWAGQTMVLTFLGASRLTDLLAAQTSTHNRQVDASWWMARLALLRLLDSPEEFDEVALAYCMAFEVSPPDWQTPRCRVVRFDADAETGHLIAQDHDHDQDQQGPTQRTDAFAPTLLMPDRPPQLDAGGVFRIQLKGDILGNMNDLTDAFTLPEGVKSVECDCQHLRRVDFGAAGALFNWVMEQQERGCHVVFVDVNRLVAAFFGVIGIADVTAVIRSED